MTAVRLVPVDERLRPLLSLAAAAADASEVMPPIDDDLPGWTAARDRQRNPPGQQVPPRDQLAQREGHQHQPAHGDRCPR